MMVFHTNQPIEGLDLLMHPGNTDPGQGASDPYVIARYTISAGDLVHGNRAIVTGSFRNMVFSADSVTVYVYHNGTQLFTVNGNTVGDWRVLTQADGTFDLAMDVVAGDTISFVVGSNSNLFADETALRATIEIKNDSDADGLDDAWETTHFGDLTSQDGTDDPDGDGYHNRDEEYFGMDPNAAVGLAGRLSLDGWFGIPGTQVNDLVSHVKFFGPPDVRELTLGTQNTLSGDDYGTRLRGTITAPITGSYTFWAAGDDGVELWLSSDDRKFGRQRIAWHGGATGINQWDAYTTQQSAPISLQAGQKYYIELLHKEAYGGDHFSVAWAYEVDDLKNWALEPGVVATQSTTLFGQGASIAVDGNIAGNWSLNEITHTDNLDNSWWQVDLGANRSLERIVIYNRTDCCAERLSNFRVSVLDATGAEVIGQDYHTQEGFVNGALAWDLPTAVTGRTVKISILGRNLAADGDGVLSLAEVQVLGSASGTFNATPVGYLKNWTQEPGVTAIQSTTEWNGLAENAIDGNRDGNLFGPAESVSHTDGHTPGNWWQTDLGAQRDIVRISIYNRTDCCQDRLSNFRILLYDAAGNETLREDFYPLTGHAGYQFKWDLPDGISAQTVRIQSLGLNRAGNHVLSFGEVEILGIQNVVAGSIVGREEIPSGVLTSYILDPDDLDDDGLPYAWEVLYGFDPNSALDGSGGAFGDPDNDLIANWWEYQLGTDPTVANSIQGALTEEVWTGIPGAYLDDLYTHPKYPQDADFRRLIHQSEGSRFLGNDTGARIRGYLEAPVTGEYRFWISGEFDTGFWMSDSEDKFSKEKLIEPHLFTNYQNYDDEPSQQSRVVTLTAGQKYYIELHHKEGPLGGRSPVSLAWQAPGGQRGLIPAQHLHSYIRHANDQDDDDLPDDWETANGLDPTDNGATNPDNGHYGDLDGDGLLNHEEYAAGTRADLTDTDGDGISDFDELQALETDALAGDVDPFQNVQNLDGSTFINSAGGWATQGTLGYSTGVRGWVEYQINVPSDGIYLLDLSVSPRIGGALSDDYEMTFTIDGHFTSRVTSVIAEGESGSLKTLTPWLTTGTHTVRIFNDNALTFRRVNLHTLEVLSSQGPDTDNNGTPDWVDSRLTRLNGIDTQLTSSKVSPVCLEGRARFPGLLSLDNGSSPEVIAGERWMTNLDLSVNATATLQATFENGAFSESLGVDWIPTNLLQETTITLRQGDAMRFTAFSGTSANGSDKVWLTHAGTTHYFKGNAPMEWQFANPGTYLFDVLHRRGNGNNASETTNQVTVTVIAPLTLESPVCVPGHVREWDLLPLPAGAILEIDSRVEVRDTIALSGGAMRHLINTDAPETRHAHIRLGSGGPILQSIPIRGMTIRDAENTSMIFVQDFGDGSYQADMPVVLSSVYPDIRVNYDIYVAGVTFTDGTLNKDLLPGDFDAFGQSMIHFIKTGTLGSACHRTSVWQGNKRIAWSW